MSGVRNQEIRVLGQEKSGKGFVNVRVFFSARPLIDSPEKLFFVSQFSTLYGHHPAEGGTQIGPVHVFQAVDGV